MLTRTLRVTRRFAASPERVFAAWIEPRLARRWLYATAMRPLAHVTIDARIGGRFCCTDDRGVEYAGEYLELIPPQRLVFALRLEGPPPAVTRVTVEIAGNLDRAVLALVHDGVPRQRARPLADRWYGMLYGLAETLESPGTAAAPRLRRSIPPRPTPAWRSAP